MVVSKHKKVGQKVQPISPVARNISNPDTFNNLHPSWCFCACDTAAWTFSANDFMSKILPKLKQWEALT